MEPRCRRSFSQPERLLHYYEFEVAPNNQWVDLEITSGDEPVHDAAWNSGFTHETRVDTGNHVWMAEMRIPLAAMNAADVKPGAEWRVNFFRAADLGTTRIENSWLGARFQKARRFTYQAASAFCVCSIEKFAALN